LEIEHLVGQASAYLLSILLMAAKFKSRQAEACPTGEMSPKKPCVVFKNNFQTANKAC
jgi:hypothetical protein